MTRMSHPWRTLILSLLTATAISCSPNVDNDCSEELVAGLMASQNISARVDRYTLTATGSKGELAKIEWSKGQISVPFPAELKFPARPGDPDIYVRLEASVRLDPPYIPGSRAETVRALAIVHPTCGPKGLFRMRLDEACAPVDGPFATCSDGRTCERGTCVDATVANASIEPYKEAWAFDEPDVCRTADGGEPAVFLGSGQTDFMPMASGAEVVAEAGPQGGHHLWLAVRMRQLNQVGTTTTITAVQPGSGLTPWPMPVVFSFRPDEGQHCKLSGLRYQLDAGGIPIESFLGKPLDVTVRLRDGAGRVATETKRVNVAAQIR